MMVLQIVLIAVFGLLGAAKTAAVPYMREAARHLGFSTGAYRVIGLLELAAAAGLLLGFAVQPVALAAAAGLVLLMAGALAMHVRNHDGARHLVPAAAMAAAAVAYVVLAV